MFGSMSLEDKSSCVSRFLVVLYKTTNDHTSSSEISSIICLRLWRGLKWAHNREWYAPIITVYSETTHDDLELRLRR